MKELYALHFPFLFIRVFSIIFLEGILSSRQIMCEILIKPDKKVPAKLVLF
ncbi:hypothetical protein HBHAL_3305 [Halobacillus halophilus DSM 2266]|uniref:Uncharacterized protein n=1 Tax=Halobacillus halophilus (strain ATCC 35676 / DSM 2266 / JCM 20832 / KCTC 3685 / LMG 17431 / NBRC 102448 / NCIMB 2269) TaxID=866895 RepID=I0JND1_HALH3|nr:hypothetical protein HBHAL_3305 [Halobacillus halophilus DSM 2266]